MVWAYCSATSSAPKPVEAPAQVVTKIATGEGDASHPTHVAIPANDARPASDSDPEWYTKLKKNKAFMLRYNSAQLCMVKAGRAMIASDDEGNKAHRLRGIDNLVAENQKTAGPNAVPCTDPEMKSYVACFKAMQVDPGAIKSSPCVRVKDFLGFGFTDVVLSKE